MKAIATLAALGALGASALTGSPASAIDSVTGTYEGKMTCRSITTGVGSKTKHDVTINVAENKESLINLRVDAGAPLVTGAVGGFIAEDTAKPDRAKIVAVECALSYAQNTGVAIHADVVIKPGSEKATLKGTLFDMDEATFGAGICTFTAKRTALTSTVPLCL